MKEGYVRFQHPFGFSYKPLELRGDCSGGTCTLYLKDPSDPKREKEIALEPRIPLDLVVGRERIGTYSPGDMARRYLEFKGQLEVNLKDREEQLGLAAATGAIIFNVETNGTRPSFKGRIRELADKCFT